MAAAACSFQGSSLLLSISHTTGKQYLPKSRKISKSTTFGSNASSPRRKSITKCGIGLQDFIGGDLVKPDLGQWLEDVEEHKALAIYSPHEGGYEGRYLNRLRYKGYRFLDLSARGLGDPETTLIKFHPVCPAHLGKQPIARWWFPPEVDYRLSLLPPNAKGLVVWILEAKVLSKAELQFLAILPSLRPRVKVIAECGNCVYTNDIGESLCGNHSKKLRDCRRKNREYLANYSRERQLFNLFHDSLRQSSEWAECQQATTYVES